MNAITEIYMLLMIAEKALGYPALRPLHDQALMLLSRAALEVPQAVKTPLAPAPVAPAPKPIGAVSEK
jgi:hypothetical protein